MKITVNSNLLIKNIFEPPITIQLKEAEASLGDLIRKLGDICYTIEFLYDTGLGNDIL